MKSFLKQLLNLPRAKFSVRKIRKIEETPVKTKERAEIQSKWKIKSLTEFTYIKWKN